jgi:hypothetical protein
MQKERAARALESGLPVPTPLPGMMSSRPPSSRPSAATRRARITLVLVASGFVAAALVYGAFTLTEQAPALAAAGAPSASGKPSLAAALKPPSVTPRSSAK